MQFEDCWPQMCCHLFIFHVYLTHIERIQKPKFTTGYKRIHIVHIQWMSWSPPLCPGAGPELFQPAQHFKNRFSLPQAWEPLSSESLHSVSIFPRTSVADYINFFLQILLPALHEHAQTWAVLRPLLLPFWHPYWKSFVHSPIHKPVHAKKDGYKLLIDVDQSVFLCYRPKSAAASFPAREPVLRLWNRIQSRNWLRTSTWTASVENGWL